jgi:uncharacterized membrane protein YhaH (DUF805 family)
MNEYLHVLRNYATFTGRARRREYWMFSLITSLITVVLELLMLPLGLNLFAPSTNTDFQGVSPLAFVLLAVLVLYTLGTFVPYLAVNVRRLHDAGYSGWLTLVGVVPLVGGLILLLLLAKDSNPGSNKWGPNPKSQNATLLV